MKYFLRNTQNADISPVCPNIVLCATCLVYKFAECVNHVVYKAVNNRYDLNTHTTRLDWSPKHEDGQCFAEAVQTGLLISFFFTN
jgi:hypothetical protein